jgi:hypothetical protein
MPDPHFEHEMTTESGGTVVFLQYPGSTTSARPIYDGRMNLNKPESHGTGFVAERFAGPGKAN